MSEDAFPATPPEETPPPPQPLAGWRLSPRQLISPALALLLCLILLIGLSLPLGPLPAPGNLFSPIGGLWSVAREARPPAQEGLQLPGLAGEVTVQVDTLGVPHIFASSDEDAAMAMGYLQARERLAQMDLQRRVASGTVSALVGPDGLENDRLMRTVGLRRAAAASLEDMDTDEPALRMLEAYSAGVNAYIQKAQPYRLPLEYKLLGVRSVEPWTPLDSLTFAKYMAWDLAHSWDDLFLAQLVESLGPEVVAELYPIDRPYDVLMVDKWPAEENSVKREAWSVKRGAWSVERGNWELAMNTTSLQSPIYQSPIYQSPIYQSTISLAAQDILARAGAAGQLHSRDFPAGSNNWAISGDRSAEGVPLLSSDPHLGYQLPSLWYQAHMGTPDMQVAGAILVGTPFVIIGHTDRIAWGLTNTEADVTDYYIERANPDNPDEVWFEGAWRPVQKLEETIEVRNGKNEKLLVTITPHGPILTQRGRTVSMRWTGLDPSFELRAFYKLNHAQNYEDFLAALRDFHVPAQNFAYADADGNIAIWAAGKYPIRATGDGRLPVPAASGTYEWTGFIPFEDLPHTLNPGKGYVFSANTRPAPPDYPYYLGWEWDPGYRGRRIQALLGEDDAVSFNEMKAVQYDVVDSLAQELVPILLEVYDARQFGGQTEASAIALLRKWDYQMSADSPAPTLWRRWLKYFREMTWQDEFSGAAVPTDYTWGYSGTNLWQPTIEYFEYLVREQPDSHWFDNVTTATSETRDDIIALSFAQAVQSLQEDYGSDAANWRWGDHHHLTIEHLLGIDALNRGGQPMEGGDMTINAQGAGERVDGGPSWRMIVQFGQPLQAVGAYPGGQSGNPLSPHYDDLLPLWLSGDLPEMPYPATADELPQDAVETSLTLTPGGAQ
jgi:penicillin amidase